MSATEQPSRVDKGKQAQRMEPDLVDSQVDDDQLVEEDNFVQAMNADDIGSVGDKDGGFYQDTLRMAMEIYDGIPEEGRLWAKQAYPWLTSRVRSAPEFGVCLKLDDNPRKPDSPFIRRIDKTKVTTLHPAFTDTHEVNGEDIGGMEILLAIGGYMNVKLRKEIDAARIDDVPVPMASLSTVSLGNARKSHAAGVYALRWKAINKIVIGYTISQGFMYRLGLTVYSNAKRITDSVGRDVDHTLNRDNFILFDLSEFDTRFSNLRWLATGLESLSILSFCSTDPAYGLNSRCADPTVIKSGYTFTQLLKVWEGVRKITAANKAIPPYKGRRDIPGGFEEWVQTELLGIYFPGDAGVYPICKIINHLSILAETNEHPSFRPLAPNAWLKKRPVAVTGPFEYSSSSTHQYTKGMKPGTAGIKRSEGLAAAARQVDIRAFVAARLSQVSGDAIFRSDITRVGQSKVKANREKKLERMRRMAVTGAVEVDELDSTSEEEAE